MTPTQQATYLRRVMRLIVQRKWKNGQLVSLAREALKRAGEKRCESD